MENKTNKCNMEKNGNVVYLLGNENEASVQLDLSSRLGVSLGNSKLIEQDESEKFQEDEQYYYPKFRALSKNIVEGHWLDFTQGDVLKNSTDKIVNQTVYPNHWRDIERWLGVVVASEWVEAQGDIPAGIDITLKIDKEQNPRVVAGLKMRPPAIHSGSVGVRFAWEKSHKGLDGFWEKLGTTVDGKVVSVVATEINGYDEFSLVYQGADRFAKQRLKQLTINNDDDKHLTKKFFKGKNDKEVSMKISNEQKAQMEKLGFKTSFLAKNEVGEWELNDNDLTEILNQVQEKQTALQAKVVALEPMAEIGKRTQENLRAETEKFYRLGVGEKTDEVILEVIQSGDIGLVESLLADYKARAEQLHPSRTRQSSDDDEQTEAATASKDVQKFKVG